MKRNKEKKRKRNEHAYLRRGGVQDDAVEKHRGAREQRRELRRHRGSAEERRDVAVEIRRINRNGE